MSEKVIINSLPSLGTAIRELTQAFKEHKWLTLSWKAGKDRTLNQNALWFGMYQRIASMTEIGDTMDARRYCKLHVGVRILLRDNDDYRDQWSRLFRAMSYEEKIQLMGDHPLLGPDGLPVTSLFDRKQGIEYTERVAAEFTQRGVVFDDMLEAA
jgi:hypothetical protein